MVTNIHGIVGHNLESFTVKITVFKISFPDLPGSDIHFVDTPGFDGTERVLKLISNWLHSMYVVIV